MAILESFAFHDRSLLTCKISQFIYLLLSPPMVYELSEALQQVLFSIFIDNAGDPPAKREEMFEDLKESFRVAQRYYGAYPPDVITMFGTALAAVADINGWIY